MYIVKYKEKDLMPVLLKVIRICEQDCAAWTWKLALALDYADLQELCITGIVSDKLDQESLDLLNAASDRTIKMLVKNMSLVQHAVKTYATLYSLNLPQIYHDDGINQLATAFYNRVCENPDIAKHTPVNQILSSFSVLKYVFDLACELLFFKKIDLDLSRDEEYWDRDDEYGTFIQHRSRGGYASVMFSHLAAKIHGCYYDLKVFYDHHKYL